MDVRYLETRIDEKRKQISQLSIDLLDLERELKAAKVNELKEQQGDTRKLLQG